MFGQTGNTPFGSFPAANQNSPFGNPAFGKPIATTNFGAGPAPVFGGASNSLFGAKPAGATPGGLFGSPTAAPAFGQPATTQSSFGGFGGTNTNTTLFGAQQNANTNLFGTGTATPAFGQPNKPAGFGFAGTNNTGLFGQSQQTTQQAAPSLFGQANTPANTSLFGTGGFGGGTATAGMSGTMVKFSPVTGSDTMLKNGVTQTISTRHHCITCMKEYELKSLEELRLEDYTAGRKGSAQGGQSAGLFGAPSQPSLFGTAGASTSTATTGFGATTGGFGATSQPATTGLFGKPMTGFGAPATTTSAFAFNSSTTTSNNPFGANTQAKPFGAATATPLFGSTNTVQTATTGFGGINGAQNPGFGTFGTPQPNQSIGLFNQNKSAFNMPASTANTGFGGFGQTTTTNSASGGLFGAKPAGTAGFGTAPAFGATTAPAFGTGTAFGTAQSTGSSLFNTSFKPAGQTTGFSFGSNATTSTGLGTNSGLNLGTGSSLFGQTKPGGLFGNTGAATTFNSTGTFGSGAGYGANTVGTGLGMGVLGGGMGSNQTQQNSGAVPVHQQILALVSTPFGDSPLLKNLLPASGKTEELLKPANSASKILNSPQYKVATNNSSPKVKARVVTAAQLSKKSLFEGLEEEDPTLLEAFQPRANAKRLVLRPKPITSPPATSQSQEDSMNSPNTTREIPIQNPEVTAAAANKENLHQEARRRTLNDDRRSSTSWLKSTLQRKTKLPQDEFEGQSSPFRSTNLVEHEIDNTIAELRPMMNAQNLSESFPVNSPQNADRSIVNTTHSTDTSLQDLDESPTPSTLAEHEPNAANVMLRRAGYYTIPNLDKLEDYVTNGTCIVPNFTVGREGYGNVYFPDSFDIFGLNLDEIVHFRHKEVIIYPDDEKKPPVGQGLNRRAQVTLDRVWPHDKTLHEPITDPERLAVMNYEGKLRRISAKHDTRFLEYRPETGSWVFKVDHFSKYGLGDSDDEDDDIPVNPDLDKLKKGAGQIPLECPGGALKKPQPSIAVEESKKGLQNVQNGTGLGGTSTGMGDLFTEKTLSFRSEVLNDSDMISGDFYCQDYGSESQPAMSPTAAFARVAGTDSHKLQLMKASFFDEDADDVDEASFGAPGQIVKKTRIIPTSMEQSFQPMEGDQTVPTGYIPMLRSNLTLVHQEASQLAKDSSRRSKETKSTEANRVPGQSHLLPHGFSNFVVKPVTVVLKFPSEVLPFEESIVGKLQAHCIADSGIQMGRTFRAGWGPGLTLVSLSTQKMAAVISLHSAFSQLGSYVSGRLLGDSTTSIVQRLQIVGGGGGDPANVPVFKESIEGHLRIQLDHCILGQEGDCPAMGAGAGTAALHAHCILAQELADFPEPEHLAHYSRDVWNLCLALWGVLPDLLSSSTNESKHHTVMVRKEALCEWLENVLSETDNRDTSETGLPEDEMLSLLSAHKLEDACKMARDTGDHCLALLMAQLGGASSVRELIRQQLALWQDTEVDSDLSPERLKLFMLVAGEPLISTKQGSINACENLDWKRALALHLWYVCPPTASITDAVDLYESSFNGPSTVAYALGPNPEYKDGEYEAEVSSGKQIQDLCFHLLKLYCTGNHPLEELLNPLTHTADPLDYRLSWLIQQVLVALGYSHLSAHVAALTHVNFAAQLETYGLWHWAIFVMLHLEDTGRRRTAINELLSRNIELDENPEYVKREEFLREELGIPSMWINKAKAIKARAVKRWGEAAWYLIQAEQWNMAHELIIEHLAADAVINENLEYLKSLLSPLVPAENNSAISGWAHQGQLLWDYMVITSDVGALLATTDKSSLGYKLELLQPQLSLLCSKINQFPCPTAKHKLCQAEIAKRTSHLARSLILLQADGSAKSTAKILAHLVAQLPLPEDYAQQELRHIVNMCVQEVGSA